MDCLAKPKRLNFAMTPCPFLMDCFGELSPRKDGVRELSLRYCCEILRNLYFCVESALFRHCEAHRAVAIHFFEWLESLRILYFLCGFCGIVLDFILLFI